MVVTGVEHRCHSIVRRHDVDGAQNVENIVSESVSISKQFEIGVGHVVWTLQHAEDKVDDVSLKTVEFSLPKTFLKFMDVFVATQVGTEVVTVAPGTVGKVSGHGDGDSDFLEMTVNGPQSVLSGI